MIPVAFDYERATSIDDAIAKLAGGGKALAGGHSIVPLMKLRLSEPGKLVDISRIPGLSGISEVRGKIEIGATTTHSEIAASEQLRSLCPMIAEAASEIGDPQVRNRGTIGGSIAHADPAADFPAVMLALEAEILIKGMNGPRTVKAADFFRGFYDVDLNTAKSSRQFGLRRSSQRPTRSCTSARRTTQLSARPWRSNWPAVPSSARASG